jgi:hypothetical protein
LYDEYAPKGIQFLRALSGEGVHAALDYQKHYRSRSPHLIDPDRAFEKRFNRNGWPFHVIVDEKGNVVYGETGLVSKNEAEIREVLDQVAPRHPSALKPFCETDYASRTHGRRKLDRGFRESFPCLISDEGGALYLSYVTNRNGGNEVYLRLLGEGAGEEELLVSKNLDDAYYAVSTVDPQGRVWIFFSALADSGKYDVFAVHWSREAGLSEAENITLSDDDAMYPDAAIDPSGRIWVAYYRWHKMGFHSRDKEIYARRFEDGAWADQELRLSPDDLPDYEDHTDPSIAPDPSGGVCVAWSWDMHETKIQEYRRYQEQYHADAPTIFGRRFGAGTDGESLLFLGHAALDYAPELYRSSNADLWCAWNSLEYTGSGYGKSLYASRSACDESDRDQQYAVEKEVLDIGQPRFAETNGRLRLFWSSQDRRRKWILKTSTLMNNEWSAPEVIDAKGDPRLVSLAPGKDGSLWMAYLRHKGAHSEIVVKKAAL